MTLRMLKYILGYNACMDFVGQCRKLLGNSILNRIAEENMNLLICDTIVYIGVLFTRFQT